MLNRLLLVLFINKKSPRVEAYRSTRGLFLIPGLTAFHRKQAPQDTQRII